MNRAFQAKPLNFSSVRQTFYHSAAYLPPPPLHFTSPSLASRPELPRECDGGNCLAGMTFDRREPRGFQPSPFASPTFTQSISHLREMDEGLTTSCAPVRSLNFTWKPFRLSGHNFRRLLNATAIRKKRSFLAVFKVAGGLKTGLGGQFETCFGRWSGNSHLKLADISVCFNLHILVCLRFSIPAAASEAPGQKEFLYHDGEGGASR